MWMGPPERYSFIDMSKWSIVSNNQHCLCVSLIERIAIKSSKIFIDMATKVISIALATKTTITNENEIAQRQMQPYLLLNKFSRISRCVFVQPNKSTCVFKQCGKQTRILWYHWFVQMKNNMWHKSSMGRDFKSASPKMNWLHHNCVELFKRSYLFP